MTTDVVCDVASMTASAEVGGDNAMFPFEFKMTADNVGVVATGVLVAVVVLFV